VLVALAFALTACRARVAPRVGGEALPAADGPNFLRECVPVEMQLRRSAGGGSTRSCGFNQREVRAWGPLPRDQVPTADCPMLVRVVGENVVAEPATMERRIDPLPFETCPPIKYLLGGRHVLRVDDGWIVAYDDLFGGETFWFDEDGRYPRRLMRGRVLGLMRGASGAPMALAAGRAYLGRGAVIRFHKNHEGRWTPRVVTVLPLEPSAVVRDSGAAGVMVGFAQGFVFRVDEEGRLENVHYLSRPIGHVSSIARSAGGAYYLGLECGILKLTPDPDATLEGVKVEGAYKEEWWSARDGASGRWSRCS
jgi:hypothetical protein